MKIKTIVGAISLSLLPIVVNAQMVPAIEQTASIPPDFSITNSPVKLNDKEKRALELVREWKKNPDKPKRGPDGSVKYLYGATLPTLVCTPLQVCVIKLQEGENVNSVTVGDSTRWIITPAEIGSGPTATTTAVVKPTESGLVTSVNIMTDRRSYTIKLVSAKHEWMPVLSFDYPDDAERAWANYKGAHAKHVYGSTLSTGESILDADFRYRISGDNPKWKPIRVYSNKTKTAIQFAESDFKGTEAPVLVVLGKDGFFSEAKPTQVNYHHEGDRYIVDYVAGPSERFALITGVDSDQQKVIIEYLGGNEK